MSEQHLIPSKEFALAVVSSSSDKLSAEEKLTLYLKAYSIAREHNKEAKEKQRKAWNS